MDRLQRKILTFDVANRFVLQCIEITLSLFVVFLFLMYRTRLPYTTPPRYQKENSMKVSSVELSYCIQIPSRDLIPNTVLLFFVSLYHRCFTGKEGKVLTGTSLR